MMQASRHSSIGFCWIFSALTLLLLVGCAPFDLEMGTESHFSPVVVDRSEPVQNRQIEAGDQSQRLSDSKSRPVNKRTLSSVQPIEAPAPDEIAILVSAEIDAMTSVARKIQQKLGERAKIYPLNNDSSVAADVIQQLSQRDNIQLVAVGLLAAQSTMLLSHPQVFCQVFNFADYGLLADGRQGVSMLPSADKVFSMWRQITPELNTVVVATGPNQQILIDTLSRGANAQGVSLQHVEVSSDKDLIYSLKQASDQVQGIWLLPDNRVLSRQVIRELIIYSVKNGKQLAVFSPQLLSGGALLSFSTYTDDIADRVVQKLELLKTHPEGKSSLSELKQLDVGINSVVAARLGLSIPATLKKNIR